MPAQVRRIAVRAANRHPPLRKCPDAEHGWRRPPAPP